MDADQNEILQYLKSWPGQFVSKREICRRAGGKWRYREDENWAMPVLQRMLELSLVESNSTGHYRLLIKEVNKEKNKKRLWASPAMRAILQKSGQNFDVIDLDKELELTDWRRDSATEINYQLNR